MLGDITNAHARAGAPCVSSQPGIGASEVPSQIITDVLSRTSAPMAGKLQSRDHLQVHQVSNLASSCTLQLCGTLPGLACNASIIFVMQALASCNCRRTLSSLACNASSTFVAGASPGCVGPQTPLTHEGTPFISQPLFLPLLTRSQASHRCTPQQCTFMKAQMLCSLRSS